MIIIFLILGTDGIHHGDLTILDMVMVMVTDMDMDTEFGTTGGTHIIMDLITMIHTITEMIIVLLT